MGRKDPLLATVMVFAARRLLGGFFGGACGALVGYYVVRAAAGIQNCHLGLLWGGIAGMAIGMIFYEPISAAIARWVNWPPRP